MHTKHERERGYNQSVLLAKSLSSLLHVPYQTLLKKTRATKQQAGLKRDERLQNLSGSFASLHTLPHMRSVLLVDDVTTTRTTLNECALVLKKAGVKNVYGIVIAHGK